MRLFEAKDYDYNDDKHNLDKPVRYTEEFLRKVAEKYSTGVLLSEHDGHEIGNVSNIHFDDGWLVGDLPSDVSLENKGLSPLFQSCLLDKGDYYEAVDGELKHIAIAENPRNHLLYNEIRKGEKMTDDVTDMLTNRVQQLERELAVKDNQIESYKKKLDGYNELQNEVKTLKEANSEFEAQLEVNTDKANKWDEYEASQRASLIDEIAGDDSTMREKISDWEIEKLRFLNEHKNISTEAKGVGNGNAEGINETPTDDDKIETERTERMDAIHGMFSELNITEE